MSFFDMDEKLLDILERVEVVYGPLIDNKVFPPDVDLTLVEGAVSSADDLRRIHDVRNNSRVVVSLGDCAVTGNVPAMRNAYGPQPILDRAYLDNVTANSSIPTVGLPALLPIVRPVHLVVDVDVFIPGCPPSAATIYHYLDALLRGERPDAGGVPAFG